MSDTANQNQAWAEWLHEDQLMLAPELSYALPSSEPVAPHQKKTIQIDIKLPKLPKLQAAVRQSVGRAQLVKLPSISIKPVAITVAAISVVAAGGVLGSHLLRSDSTQVASGKSTVLAVATKKVATLDKPTFSVLAPQNKAYLGETGRSDTAYDGSRNTFSFKDNFEGTDITVSEQPTPKDFSNAEDAAQKAAKSVKADEELPTNKGKAYIFTDTKANAQIIVYGAHDILTFIQSPFKKDPLQWRTYLDGMQ